MTHVRSVGAPFEWRGMMVSPQDVRERILGRLRSILQSWEHTPYRSRACVKKVGADCVRYGLAIIDELRGLDRLSQVQTVSDDVCMHDAKTAFETVSRIEGIYQPLERVWEPYIEPGDLILVGPPGGGPGHLQIVGPDPNTIWHCDRGTGVCRTGMGVRDGHERIFRAYRFGDRLEWDR